jgi:uncharacterized membrane protein YgcG
MRIVLAALVALLLWQHQATAEERITSFTSEATVNRDATLDVVETIAAVAEGDQIRHGIYRDFPTTYTDIHGNRVVVGFTVQAVTRDGSDENYVIENIGNGKRVKIGNADVYVAPGPHIYQITYSTNRQIGFFTDYDELYWNVTGNAWLFPIERAVAIIHLPQGADIIQYKVYTGRQGKAASDARVDASRGTLFRAASTRPFARSEGMTVAVAWPKGIVTPPSQVQQALWFARDNAVYGGIAATFLIVIGYFATAWSRFGRDPKAGTIVPLFAPPEGLGPSAVRYVWHQNSDDKGFAAALVGLAVKGRLQISDTDEGYAITKAANQGVALTGSEQTLYSALPSGNTRLENTNHAAISRARTALDSHLDKEFTGTAFVRNTGLFWIGALLSVAGVAFSAFMLPGDKGMTALFAAVWSGIWWGVIFTAGWSSLRRLFTSSGFFQKLGALASTAFIVPFVIAGVAVPSMLIFSGGQGISMALLVGAAAGLAIVNFIFAKLLPAPTPSGRKLLDQIEGFRMYMRTAEERRLNALNPPEKTPALFERYLPYALALDCENEWSEKFSDVLAAAAIAGASAPIWYSGSHWSPNNMGTFTHSIGTGLASSTAAASVAPGSSSGSGGSSGGGSSGGGGGGGGGGGW